MTEIRAINCTSCGAGLDVLGGGRVTTHICGYCGSELDTNDNYKVLRQFADMPRPASPFRIGMQGEIKGVAWTIIGTLGQEERWDGRVWRWTDHQLFSPTHGYAWLTVEDGHLTFTRRVRGAGTRAWISEHWVETAEHPPTIKLSGMSFKYYETSTSTVTFAEGEFNYRPEVGETRQHISALNLMGMLSFSQSGAEREVDFTEYLDHATTVAAFGVTDAPAPQGTHPTQPYEAPPNQSFLAKASTICAGICLVLTAWFWTAPGQSALDVRDVAITTLPQEFTFDVPETGRLTKLRVSGDVRDGWAFVEAYVTGPDDAPVFETGRTLERYRGIDEGERWSEGSRSSTIRFRPEQTGTYSVELAVSETGKWFGRGIRRDTAPAIGQVSLSVENGVGSGFWTFWLMVGFALMALWQIAGPAWHRHNRWAGSDWTEDD